MLLVPLWVALSLGVQTLVRGLLGAPRVPFSRLPPRQLALSLGAALLTTFLLVWGLSVPFFHEPIDEPTNEVKVKPDSPAAEAGLETGDVVTRVNGTLVTRFADIISAREAVDEPTALEWTRAGRALSGTITPRDHLLGLGSNRSERIEPTWGAAAWKSLTFLANAPRAVIASLRATVSRATVTAAPSGTASALSWTRWLCATATLSWWLAVGGELAVVLVVHLARRR